MFVGVGVCGVDEVVVVSGVVVEDCFGCYVVGFLVEDFVVDCEWEYL